MITQIKTSGVSMTPYEYFEDDKTKEKYSRVCGGFSWPAKKPGFLVVVGESFEEDKTINRKVYKILNEYSDIDPVAMISKGAAIQKFYAADPVYGDTTVRSMMEVLHSSNKKFYLADSPFVGERDGFQTMLLMIRRLVNPTQKALSFGSGSALPGFLSEVKPEDIPDTYRTAAMRHPELAALGHVISAMEVWTAEKTYDELVPEFAGMD